VEAGSRQATKQRKERVKTEFAENAEGTEERRKQNNRREEKAAARLPHSKGPASKGQHRKTKVGERRDG
jgi:hypothetical protein